MQPVQFVRLHSVQDPFDFQAAFDELMECSSSVENWGQIKKGARWERSKTNIEYWG